MTFTRFALICNIDQACIRVDLDTVILSSRCRDVLGHAEGCLVRGRVETLAGRRVRQERDLGSIPTDTSWQRQPHPSSGPQQSLRIRRNSE
jgi:hypothetical protein